MTTVGKIMDIPNMAMTASELTKIIETTMKKRGMSRLRFAKDANVPYHWLNDVFRPDPPKKLNMEFTQRVLKFSGMEEEAARHAYDEDEDLFKKCAIIMQETIKEHKIKMDFTEASACVMHLYLDIKKLNLKGKQIEPNELNALRIIEKRA